MNPVGNVYCDRCNARIVPMASSPTEEPEPEQPPIKGVSLPTIPLEEQRQQTEETAWETTEEEEMAEDWLSQLRASTGAEDQGEDVIEEPGTEDVEERAEAEDWLAQLRALTDEEEELEEPDQSEISEAVPEPIEPAEIPDWLREMGPVGSETTPPTHPTPEPQEEASAAPAPESGEIPDWLRQMGPAEDAPPTPPAAEATPGPQEEAPAAPAPEPGEIPDWLRQMGPAEDAPPTPPAAEATSEPQEEAPSPTPFVGVTASEVEEAPEWLQEVSEREPSPETAEPSEWLAELEESPAPPAEPAPPVFEGVEPPIPSRPGTEARTAETEGLARAEIPDWLKAMRPTEEPSVVVPEEEEPVEAEGLLEGLRGVIPPAPNIEIPPATTEAAPPTQTSEATLARAQLLESLLTRTAEAPQLEASKRGIGAGEQVLRGLVKIVLLLVTVGALLAPMFVEEVPDLVQPAGSTKMDQLYGAVDSVDAGDIVLVAFEYGPAEANELDLVASSIVRHLVDQEARISIASTRPEGLMLAQGLLGDPPEERYSMLPYRPGGASGVAQLLTDVDTRPTLIVVLTAQPNRLRWWIEQVHAKSPSLYGNAGRPPMVAGVSAALEQAASPYLDTNVRQLEGVVSGLNGAAAYAARRQESEEDIAQQLNALAVGHVTIIGLLLLGAVVYGIGGSGKGGK